MAECDNDKMAKDLKASIQLPGGTDATEMPNLSTDLTPVEIHVKLQNTTAGTCINATEKIQVIQILESGLILQIPEKSCAAGHKLLLTLVGQDTQRRFVEMEATAQVNNRNNIAPRIDEIALKFLQFDEAKWKSLVESIERRQKEILQFFEASRG